MTPMGPGAPGAPGLPVAPIGPAAPVRIRESVRSSSTHGYGQGHRNGTNSGPWSAGMTGKQTGIAGGAAETVWPGPQLSLFQEEVLSKQEVIALIECSVFVVKVDCTQVSAPGILDSERYCFVRTDFVVLALFEALHHFIFVLNRRLPARYDPVTSWTKLNGAKDKVTLILSLDASEQYDLQNLIRQAAAAHVSSKIVKTVFIFFVVLTVTESM